MLRNGITDFAVQHRFGCRGTEPGYAGNIDAVEIWLLDWKIQKYPILTFEITSKVIFAPLMPAMKASWFSNKWPLKWPDQIDFMFMDFSSENIIWPG